MCPTMWIVCASVCASMYVLCADRCRRAAERGAVRVSRRGVVEATIGGCDGWALVSSFHRRTSRDIS